MDVVAGQDIVTTFFFSFFDTQTIITFWLGRTCLSTKIMVLILTFSFIKPKCKIWQDS